MKTLSIILITLSILNAIFLGFEKNWEALIGWSLYASCLIQLHVEKNKNQ